MGGAGLSSRLKAELHYPIPNSIPGPGGRSLSCRRGREEQRFSWFKAGGPDASFCGCRELGTWTSRS